MLQENELVPFTPSRPIGDRILVFAPHPDDETIGMGGSLRILSDLGKKIKVVVITQGEKAEPDFTKRKRHAEIRQKEAVKAFHVLGVTDFTFLGFPDRELEDNFIEVERVCMELVREFSPDTVYSTSPIELHPDHRVVALLSFKIKEELPHIRLVFYEVLTPLRPNVLVDVTKSFRYKKRALQCYRSQLNKVDYIALVTALNTFRRITLQARIRTAEAFWEVVDSASRDYIERWLSYKIQLVLK